MHRIGRTHCLLSQPHPLAHMSKLDVTAVNCSSFHSTFIDCCVKNKFVSLLYHYLDTYKLACLFVCACGCHSVYLCLSLCVYLCLSLCVPVLVTLYVPVFVTLCTCACHSVFALCVPVLVTYCVPVFVTVYLCLSRTVYLCLSLSVPGYFVL